MEVVSAKALLKRLLSEEEKEACEEKKFYNDVDNNELKTVEVNNNDENKEEDEIYSIWINSFNERTKLIQEINSFYENEGCLVLLKYLIFIETFDNLQDLTLQNLQEEDESNKTIKNKTVEDYLINIDLSIHLNKEMPLFLQQLQNDSFIIYKNYLQLLTKLPQKENFLFFLQNEENTEFMKNFKLDELKSKFIEKNFLKLKFPTVLKNREKKMEFLVNLCNDVLQRTFKDEDYTLQQEVEWPVPDDMVESFKEYFFNDYLKSLQSFYSISNLNASNLQNLKENYNKLFSITNKTIILAQRLIIGCVRNIIIIYFIQVIFTTNAINENETILPTVTVSTEEKKITNKSLQEKEEEREGKIPFHQTKEFLAMNKQFEYTFCLIDKLKQEREDYFLFYKKEDKIFNNVTINELYKKKNNLKLEQLKNNCLQSEKLLNVFINENLLKSYFYLNKLLRKNLELNGYGNTSLELFIRDLLFFIFKYFNAFKLTNVNEKNKIKKVQNEMEEFMKKDKRQSNQSLMNDERLKSEIECYFTLKEEDWNYSFKKCLQEKELFTLNKNSNL
ncbi:hypothetical protein ABK040_014451 [Willaertia magna]